MNVPMRPGQVWKYNANSRSTKEVVKEIDPPSDNDIGGRWFVMRGPDGCDVTWSEILCHRDKRVLVHDVVDVHPLMEGECL